MGFDAILDRWRTAGRSGDAVLVAQFLKTLETQCPNVVQNLRDDPHIADAVREELLAELLGCNPADAASLSATFEAFCRNGKRQIGPRDAIAETSTLGHCMPRSKLEGQIGSTGASASPLKPKWLSPSSVVDRILRSDLDRQRKRLRLIHLSKRQMWSFYDADALDQPFRNVGTSASELRRRLGLGRLDLSAIELLTVVHQLSDDIIPHTPTTFDGQISEYYQCGGRSRPLAAPYNDGLPEVVHDPVTGGHLAARIETAR